MKHTRISPTDPVMNPRTSGQHLVNELGWHEQRIANAPVVAAKIADAVQMARANVAPKLGGGISPQEWLRSVARMDRKKRATARARAFSDHAGSYPQALK